MSKVTMQELELETAELLPARETLWCYRGPSHTTTIDSGNGNYDGNGDGNFGLLSGNLDGDLDGNTIVLL
jgi:hypothetical protein